MMNKKVKIPSKLMVKEVILPSNNGDSIEPVTNRREINDDLKSNIEFIGYNGKQSDNLFDTEKRKSNKKKRNKKINTKIIFNCFTKPELHPNETLLSNNNNVIEEIQKVKEKKRLEKQIEAYQNQRKSTNEKNYRTNRLREEKMLENQENLAETWYGILQRRKEINEKFSKSCCEVNPYEVPIKTTWRSSKFRIRLLPRKFWMDDEEDSQLDDLESNGEGAKSTSKFPICQTTDNEIEETRKQMMETLVFVDDDDDEEDDKGTHSTRLQVFKRSSFKEV